MPAGRVPATGEIINQQTPFGAPIAKTQYVNKVGLDGWLLAKSAHGELLSLHKYAKLEITRVSGGRTYFKVREGTHTGKELSLRSENAKEYLGVWAPVPRAAKIVVTYGGYVEGWVSEARRGQRIDQQLAAMRVEGLSVDVTMNSVWDQGFTPLSPGTYKVLLPDVPHQANMTSFYRAVAPTLRYDQVWFPIQHGDNSRYVHVGNVSDGCVTVLTLDKWASVHEILARHRSPDGRSVAELTVTGKPERAK